MERVFGCDTAKRDWLLTNRHFDLLDMAEVFDDEKRFDVVDTRFDYGEERRVTVGRALGAVFTVVYTMRDTVTWLITAWPANRKERGIYGSD